MGTALEDLMDGMNIDKAVAAYYWKLGRFEKAAILAEKLLEKFPDEEGTNALLHDCYMKMGLRDKADGIFRKFGGKLDPSDAGGEMMVAMEVNAAVEREDYAQVLTLAVRHIPKAEMLQKKKFLGFLYKYKSIACSKLDRDAEAAAAQRKAAELCPTDLRAQLLVYIMDIYVANAQEDFAEIDRLAALGIKRSHELGYTDFLPAFYEFQYKALRKLGDVEEALLALKSWQTEKPSDPEVYANLSDTLNALNRHEEALEAQEKYVELEPQNEHAKLVLASRLQRVLEMENSATVQMHAARKIGG